MLSGEAGKDMIKMDEKDIISKVVKELEYYIPHILDNVNFNKLFRWEYAEPLSQVDRAKNIKEYRENFDENCLIYLAGDYMSMPFSEGGAESAIWITNKIETSKR